MNNERNNTTAGGIGFCGLLTVAFIVLKLTGVINWSWLWVLAPIWIPTAITNVRCVRQGRELPREEIAAIFEPDEEGGEQE